MNADEEAARRRAGSGGGAQEGSSKQGWRAAKARRWQLQGRGWTDHQRLQRRVTGRRSRWSDLAAGTEHGRWAVTDTERLGERHRRDLRNDGRAERGGVVTSGSHGLQVSREEGDGGRAEAASALRWNKLGFAGVNHWQKQTEQRATPGRQIARSVASGH